MVPRFYAVVSLVLLAAPALGGAAHADDVAIKSIIPHDSVGSESCFQGDFSDKAIDMTAWPSYAEQAHAREAPVEQRPVARKLPAQSVSSVRLYLNFTNGREARNESWDLDFTVGVTSPSLGQDLFARSGCTWSGWDATQEKDRSPEFQLACWIECDGGNMRAERVPGTGDLDLYFSRLFMQAGCEGGGRVSVADSEESENVAFRLRRAPLEVCTPLKEWDTLSP